MLGKRVITNRGAMKGCKLSVLLLLSLLGACASPSVVVKTYVPPPLVDKLPLTASLKYTDAFTQYTYQEAQKKRALKSVNFGVAQVAMFDTVFAQMLNLVEPEAPLKDLVIEPEILDFQYTAPRETKLNLYEVWLRYRLRITDSNDKEVADWVVKGYGKTPTALLTSASAAFNAATNVALRDVGAQLSIGFHSQPDIASLLKNNNYKSVQANTGDQLVLEEPLEPASQVEPESDPAALAEETLTEENSDENQ